MTAAVQDLRVVPLSELIGASLVAMIQADVQATRAVIDYIQMVGFVPREASTKGMEESLGEMRMADFVYSKHGADGIPTMFHARLPLLSLAPIPGVRVKRARISFTAKITDVYREGATGAISAKSISGTGQLQRHWLKPTITQLRGGLAARGSNSDSLSGATRGSYEIAISIELEQTPIAAGLEKLLHAFDQAIRDEQENA
jgi:Protein of unknown function (DUF2589)